jgi:toxin CcdB
MPQFDVYENNDARTRKRTPYLLDIQSDILESLATRVVVPLRPYLLDKNSVISKLHPAIKVGGSEYRAVVNELAGVRSSVLGKPVYSAAEVRQQLLEAYDFIVTGF